MAVEYAPDARQRFARIGSAVLTLPFNPGGEALSGHCVSSMLCLADDGPGSASFAVVALAGPALLSGQHVALHLNLDARLARNWAASLLELAAMLEAEAGQAETN